MNVKSIVNRKPDEQGKTRVSVEAMIFVIQEYVKEARGNTVVINLEKGLNRRNVFFEAMYTRQLERLIDAFGFASQYFIKKYNGHQDSNNTVKTT